MTNEEVRMLLKILKATGFSFGELSSLLLIQRTVISNWYYGKRNPSPMNLVILLRLKQIVLQYKDSLNKDNIINEVNRLKQTPDFARLLNVKYSERDYLKTKANILSKNKACQLCGTIGGGIDCHHIVYRSEAPDHPHLHHENNLIVICRRCHNTMHRIKSLRDKLIEDRGLKLLFPTLFH